MIEPNTLAKPITITRQLTVEELKSLQFPMKIQGNLVTFEESLRGYKLKQPIEIKLDKMLAAREKGLVAYIITTAIPYQVVSGIITGGYTTLSPGESMGFVTGIGRAFIVTAIITLVGMFASSLRGPETRTQNTMNAPHSQLSKLYGD